MTIYCFDDEFTIRQNLYVTQILDTSSRMYEDIFVAKLGCGKCGQHGWARYEDVCPAFLQNTFENKMGKEKIF